MTHAWWDDDRSFFHGIWPGSGGEHSVVILKKGDGDENERTLMLDGSETVVKDGQVTIRDKHGKKVKLDKDADLESLREDPRFAEVAAAMKEEG